MSQLKKVDFRSMRLRLPSDSLLPSQWAPPLSSKLLLQLLNSWTRQTSQLPSLLVTDSTLLWMRSTNQLALISPWAKLSKVTWWASPRSVTTLRRTSLLQAVTIQPGNSGLSPTVIWSWAEKVTSIGLVVSNSTPRATFSPLLPVMEQLRSGISLEHAALRLSLSTVSPSGKWRTMTQETSFCHAQWTTQWSFGIWTCQEADTLSEAMSTQWILFSSCLNHRSFAVVAETRPLPCGTSVPARTCRLSTAITTP